LVPYRFTQDEYVRQTQRWEAKGAHRIVPKFLDEFEDFFEEYYDTEIFSARVWDRLDKDPANLQRFCEKLNFVLGVNTWDQTFSRGIVHYNYRRIDEDIFGKSYESRPTIYAWPPGSQKTGPNFSSARFAFLEPLFPFSKSLGIKSSQRYRVGIRRDIIGKKDREPVSRAVNRIN
jgi:hypothetical protein